MVELQKGVNIKGMIWLLEKYKGLTPSEALEIAKQKLTALATRLRYTRKVEAKKINGLFSKVPPKVYSHLQCNNCSTAINSRNKNI